MKGTETALRKLFDGIDRNKNGKLDKDELQAAFARAGIAVPSAKLDRFFGEVDSNHDGTISFDEWRCAVNHQSFQLWPSRHIVSSAQCYVNG